MTMNELKEYEDDQRICCKCCMRKRTFFIILFLIVLICDAQWVIGFFTDMSDAFKYGMYWRDYVNYEQGQAYIKLLKNLYLTFWAATLMWLVKVYYEIKWFFIYRL